MSVRAVILAGLAGLAFAGDAQPADGAAPSRGLCIPLLRLAPTSPESTAPNPYDLARADFDGDGRDDLAVGTPTGVDVLLGRGGGDFAPAPTSPEAAGDVYGVVAGDFTGDGRADVAASLFAGQLLLLVGHGNGDFTAQPPRDYGAPLRVRAGADFNADGRTDAVAVTEAADAVHVLHSDGSGGFAEAQGSPVATSAGVRVREATTGDLNGDGRPDVVATGTFAPLVLLGTGDGVARVDQPFSDLSALDASITVAAIADYDGDGHADLAGAGFSTLGLLHGDGSGRFGPPTGVTDAHESGVVAADFDGDGRSDVAGLGREFGPTGDSRAVIDVLLGDGSGDLRAAAGSPLRLGPSTTTTPTLGDFDQNGLPDLAALSPARSSTQLDVALNTGGVAPPGHGRLTGMDIDRSRERLRFGQKVEITGRVLCGTGDLSGRPARLYRRKAGVGGAAWRRVGRDRTDDEGSARWSDRPSRNVVYRWRTRRGVSETTRVDVEPRITVTSQAGRMVFGRVRPATPGGRVLLQRQAVDEVSGEAYFATVDRDRMSATGAFALRRGARDIYRIVRRADRGHLRGELVFTAGEEG
jgi:hypothetical protein